MRIEARTVYPVTLVEDIIESQRKQPACIGLPINACAEHDPTIGAVRIDTTIADVPGTQSVLLIGKA